MRRTRPPLVEERNARGRQSDKAGRCLYQAPIRGIFPHGELRARGAPRVHGVGIRAIFAADPFQQIEDQILDGVAHHPHTSIDIESTEPQTGYRIASLLPEEFL